MKKISKRWYLLMISCTIVALFFMVLYNFVVFRTNVRQNVENVGLTKLENNKELLESYLVKRMEVVRTASISVEYMMEKNESVDEIEQLLIYESKGYMIDIDSNFTGIYGVFDGVYLDGSGWVPDDDYDPKTRDWYKEAVKAKGQIALVPPYVDAQTGDVMISLSKMLSDGKSVISLDIKMDYIQELTEGISINDMGYGFVADENGLIIAHKEAAKKGENFLSKESSMYELMTKAKDLDNQCFEINVDKETYTVFVDTIMGMWKVLLIVEHDQLFEESNDMLWRNILVSLAVSSLIIVFFLLAYAKTSKSIRLEKESNEKIENMNHKIISALVRTIDAKDRYTNGHSLRVAEYSKEIARRMGKTPKEQETIYYAGLLHDVGKIRIPVDIINKPGKLTDEEYEQMKIHPVTSYHILKDAFEDEQVKNGAKFHHERYDGTGYPNGLKQTNIPEVARIVGVADAYDAMASNRSYRKYLPQDVIREEIEKGKGTQFDPEIADVMLKMIDDDKDYSMKESKSIQKTILVVDDEQMNIKMVEIILKDTPMYKVIGATSGTEALEVLAEQEIDIILLDIMMPGMNGFETIPLIREKYDVPIVLMTGDRNIETIEKASKYGVEDYLTKPFLPLALKEIIHSILS